MLSENDTNAIYSDLLRALYQMKDRSKPLVDSELAKVYERSKPIQPRSALYSNNRLAGLANARYLPPEVTDAIIQEWLKDYGEDLLNPTIQGKLKDYLSMPLRPNTAEELGERTLDSLKGEQAMEAWNQSRVDMDAKLNEIKKLLSATNDEETQSVLKATPTPEQAKQSEEELAESLRRAEQVKALRRRDERYNRLNDIMRKKSEFRKLGYKYQNRTLD